MDEDVRYQEAIKRVKEIKGFYTHLIVYLIVNAGLFLIDMLTSGGRWFFWPLIGWGIGIVMHGINVFGIGGWLGKEWEDKKVKEIMEKYRDK
ncbi:MAG: 2TM domain-containing protein [Peptococcaceae bacterium]|nr:2TM domain-containing protein [Peptococcaceae bacterium]